MSETISHTLLNSSNGHANHPCVGMCRVCFWPTSGSPRPVSPRCRRAVWHVPAPVGWGSGLRSALRVPIALPEQPQFQGQLRPGQAGRKRRLEQDPGGPGGTSGQFPRPPRTLGAPPLWGALVARARKGAARKPPLAIQSGRIHVRVHCPTDNKHRTSVPLGRTRAERTQGRMGMTHGPGPHKHGLWARTPDSKSLSTEARD